MTLEIAGYIAWALVGVLFLGIVAWIVGYVQGLRRPCPACQAQLRYQMSAQQAFVNGTTGFQAGVDYHPSATLVQAFVEWEKER